MQWEGYVSGFHEIRWISKDQLPRMVRPMFNILSCGSFFIRAKQIRIYIKRLKILRIRSTSNIELGIIIFKYFPLYYIITLSTYSTITDTIQQSQYYIICLCLVTFSFYRQNKWRRHSDDHNFLLHPGHTIHHVFISVCINVFV